MPHAEHTEFDRFARFPFGVVDPVSDEMYSVICDALAWDPTRIQKYGMLLFRLLPRDVMQMDTLGGVLRLNSIQITALVVMLCATASIVVFIARPSSFPVASAHRRQPSLASLVPGPRGASRSVGASHAAHPGRHGYGSQASNFQLIDHPADAPNLGAVAASF